MRDILFRGKPKNNNEFYHFSNVWRDCIKDGFVIGSLIVAADRYYICVSTIGANKSAINNSTVSMIEVIPDTVGQYTGLTDKNGDEIFEGDILNGFEYPFLDDEENHNYYAEVCWFNNSPAFGICTVKNPNSTIRGISDGNSDYIEDFKSELWEIIGNIHDNPELLKEVH